MKKSSVSVGKVYKVKVSGKVVSVRLTSQSPFGGWHGVNEATGCQVRIRSAARLRREVLPAQAAAVQGPAKDEK